MSGRHACVRIAASARPAVPTPAAHSTPAPRAGATSASASSPASCPPRSVQRYRCLHCRRVLQHPDLLAPPTGCSRPELLKPLFFRLLACSGFRQIARELERSPTTTLVHLAARLGRHCLLFQRLHQPRPLRRAGRSRRLRELRVEPVLPLPLPRPGRLASRTSSTASPTRELRRKGRMTPRQRAAASSSSSSSAGPTRARSAHEVAALLRLCGLSTRRASSSTPTITRPIPRALPRAA